jgi:beta-xylosidase
MGSRRNFLGKIGAAMVAFPFSKMKSQAEGMLPGYRNPKMGVDERVRDLLGWMTLEEKAAQTVSTSLPTQPFTDAGGKISSEKVRGLLRHGIGELTRPGLSRDSRGAAILCNQIQKFLVEETRLGIPAIVHEESLHGVMGDGATSFPQAIALASTWNPDLVEEVFTVAAAEARSRGAHQVLTPVVGVGRDARWGRIQETYGEDPYLVSRMAVACVRGFQGRGPVVGERHVISTLKHFAVHSQPEGGQTLAPGNYSLRTIHENFLPPFRAAVTEAGALAVMASYNEVDGIPNHANRWLLQKVLREEWGFQGIVVSDYFGVHELQSVHHIVSSNHEAGKKAIEAGVDVELPVAVCYKTLADQVREGAIAEATLDKAVARVLRLKFLLGLFENPYVSPDEAASVTSDSEHAKLAGRAAREAIILLKNEKGLLPLDRNKIKSIAVIGPNAAECHLGDYSGKPLRKVSILQGIQNKVSAKTKVEYAEGCEIVANVDGLKGHKVKVLPPVSVERQKIAEAITVARRCDVVLLVLGGNELTCNESVDRDSLDLLGGQNELVQAILATGKPTIVFLINGRPLSINYIAEHVPAILEGWFLGQETGNAVADVLFGDYNPGGKLPITFPRSVGEIPCYYNYKPSAHLQAYLLVPEGPLFSFGHGLSYTSFEYSSLRINPSSIRAGDEAAVSINIRNTGSRAGDEVIQLYIRDEVSSVTRPVKELKGFQRVHLSSGESRTVVFKLTPAELSFLNEEMEWVVEPGTFKVMVGSSSISFQTADLRVV